MEKSVVSSHRGLVLKVIEAMDALGIPKDPRGKPLKVREEFREIGWVNQEYVLNSVVYPTLLYGPRNEKGHAMRVALRGMQVSNLLGFENDARALEFIGDLYHDIGKLSLRPIYPEYNSAKKDPKKFEAAMRMLKLGHVSPEKICSEYGPVIASKIEQHHRHQHFYSEPYPAELSLETTPLSIASSKILALKDCEEALTNRPCMQTHRLHTPEEVIEGLMNEYGEMRIEYEGNSLPRLSMRGEDLIFLQERMGIIGRKRPANVSEEDFRINPFVGIKIK